MAQPPAPPMNPKLQLSPKAIKLGIERLERCISDLTAFDIRTMFLGESPQLTSIELAIRDSLERSFGENTAAHYRYIDAANLQFGGIFDFLTGSATAHKGNIPQSIARSIALLKAAQAVLKEDLADHEHAVKPESPVVPDSQQALSRKVFVVHGHDEGARETVARFLEKLGLEAIILQEKPDQGRTIIEKFEDTSDDIGFAVVLLTPDDLGGSVKADTPDARARQNVIFELGYFAAKLGRGRVCLLRKGHVEIPSDLYGVIYTDMDPADGWKAKLVGELKAAKLDFDATRFWQ